MGPCQLSEEGAGLVSVAKIILSSEYSDGLHVYNLQFCASVPNTGCFAYKSSATTKSFFAILIRYALEIIEIKRMKTS